MNKDKLEIIKNRAGFIAALDQSGGSSAKTLEAYGISKDSYSNEEEMFDLIHKMRARVFTSPVFNSDRIIGAILFYKTMESMVDGVYTAEYLWTKKNIVSFLKVDKGLEDEALGVRLMKEIPDLDEQLTEANNKGVFGTKMRSVINSYNEEGIRKIVDQQFEFAKKICSYGLVPIIEPEVTITSPEKDKIEHFLKEEIAKKLQSWNEFDLVMLKLSIPTTADLYLDLYNYKAIVRIVALSGGYPTDEACKRLSNNHKMAASFSRALLQNLSNNQTEEEFNKALDHDIEEIYQASIK